MGGVVVGGIPACLCRSPVPQPRGELRGLARGVSPVPTWGGLQVHSCGRGLQGAPGPHLGGIGIPACTEADPPQTATAAGGTHRTGMHSCLN